MREHMSRTHHAILLRTSTAAALAAATPVPELPTEELRFAHQQLTVDTVRDLAITCTRRPQQAERLRVVVWAGSITTEAQNALLKLLEEPPETTELIFGVPAHVPLLATVHSRFAAGAVVADEPDPVWTELMTRPVSDRLAEIDRRLKGRDSEWCAQAAADIRRALTGTSIPPLPPRMSALVVTFLNTRGASNKQLLETAALYWGDVAPGS